MFFAEWVAKSSKTREDIKTWADLLELDDFVSFGARREDEITKETVAWSYKPNCVRRTAGRICPRRDEAATETERGSVNRSSHSWLAVEDFHALENGLLMRLREARSGRSEEFAQRAVGENLQQKRPALRTDAPCSAPQSGLT